MGGGLSWGKILVYWETPGEVEDEKTSQQRCSLGRCPPRELEVEPDEGDKQTWQPEVKSRTLG